MAKNLTIEFRKKITETAAMNMFKTGTWYDIATSNVIYLDFGCIINYIIQTTSIECTKTKLDRDKWQKMDTEMVKTS